MKSNKPTPDSGYRKSAARLRALLEQGTPSETKASLEYSVEKHSLKQQLREKFQRAFGFSKDRHKLADRFCRRFKHTTLAPKFGILDHEEFFQRGINLVIVSQPHGTDLPKLADWAEESGASCTVAADWGYRSPGQATLFFLEFTPTAKASFEKRLRSL